MPVCLHLCTFFHETKVGLVEEKLTQMPSKLFGGKRSGQEWGKAAGGFIVCPRSQYVSKCEKENSKTDGEKNFFSHERQEKITRVRN